MFWDWLLPTAFAVRLLGIALFGYCPGVLGMLIGANVYVALYPLLQPVIKGLGDADKITLPGVTQISPWRWVGGLVVAGAPSSFGCSTALDGLPSHLPPTEASRQRTAKGFCTSMAVVI
jgi:hypothetical protein